MLRQASMLVLLMWLVGGAAPAQNAPEPAAGDLPADQTAAPAPESATAPETAAAPTPNATAKSPDTFTPSEEISEDLSVSFPVDI